MESTIRRLHNNHNARHRSSVHLSKLHGHQHCLRQHANLCGQHHILRAAAWMRVFLRSLRRLRTPPLPSPTPPRVAVGRTNDVTWTMARSAVARCMMMPWSLASSRRLHHPHAAYCHQTVSPVIVPVRHSCTRTLRTRSLQRAQRRTMVRKLQPARHSNKERT